MASSGPLRGLYCTSIGPLVGAELDLSWISIGPPVRFTRLFRWRLLGLYWACTVPLQALYGALLDLYWTSVGPLLSSPFDLHWTSAALGFLMDLLGAAARG